jgi:hypothetical protein
MECEKNMCPVIKLDGVLATGKQFDLDITLPEDNRSVIYGVVSDSCHNPVCDAVVKLVEVVNDCGKEDLCLILLLMNTVNLFLVLFVQINFMK